MGTYPSEWEKDLLKKGLTRVDRLPRLLSEIDRISPESVARRTSGWSVGRHMHKLPGRKAARLTILIPIYHEGASLLNTKTKIPLPKLLVYLSIIEKMLRSDLHHFEVITLT